MAFAVTDIVVGPLRIYTAPVGTTLPVDTLAEDAAWPAGWAEIAYTKEPLTMAVEIETFDVMVEQSQSPVSVRITGQKLEFETILAEFRTQNMAYALGGTHTAVTPPGAGTEGLETFTMGGEMFPGERAWGFEGKMYSSAGTAYPIRVFIYRGIVSEGGELEFSKSDYAGIPLKIRALADTARAVGQQLFRVARVLPPTS